MRGTHRLDGLDREQRHRLWLVPLDLGDERLRLLPLEDTSTAFSVTAPMAP